MSIFIVFVPVALVIMVGLGFLQAYLSKREGNVPGLIIPGISFLLSLIWPLNMISPDGNPDYVGMLLVLLLANIPTYIYLAIYFVCREKYQKKNQMDRMNIQDLD
jgi:hypothetical protein